MRDQAIGRTFRLIRVRTGLRQVDVAAASGCSQADVSRLERGALASLPLAKVRRLCETLDASLVATIRWHGGELDRLLDEGHATVVAVVADILRRAGWRVETEVTFAIYGERGSIDLLAWHPPTRTLLVVEVKTEITSIEETERRLDTKVRLASRVWQERGGKAPRVVGRLLAVADTSTNRRRIERHAAIFDPAYPERGSSVRAWLHAPAAALRGLLSVVPRLPGSHSPIPAATIRVRTRDPTRRR